MHLLRSTAIGTEIIDNTDHHVHGKVDDLLIDPDRGKVIAVLLTLFGSPALHALQTEDIESWGNRIHIRGIEAIGEVTDFIRLEPFLAEERHFAGQRIQTEHGQHIGTCVDYQFRTDTFDIEWIFRQKWIFFKGPALPTSEILEVTPKAIIVKDQGPLAEVVDVEEVVEGTEVKTVISPATGRAANRYTHD